MADPEVAAEIIRHYEQDRPEDTRLSRGAGRLELARTQELIRRHLDRGELRILDVGGASGVHAEWLAGDGHHVHVVDPVPSHVEQANDRGRHAGAPFTAELGDARRLSHDDASVDAVLLLGPLYHLVDRADRVTALSEARRVVRPGGHVFVAAISRFASLYDGLTKGLLHDAGFRAVVDDDLRSGQHRNPSGRADWFTTAYFHRPEQLTAEAVDAGLEIVGLFGVEGMSAWLLRSDPDGDLTSHLDAARLVEQEPAVVGVSPHLLLVARRGPASGGGGRPPPARRRTTGEVRPTTTRPG